MLRGQSIIHAGGVLGLVSFHPRQRRVKPYDERKSSWQRPRVPSRPLGARQILPIGPPVTSNIDANDAGNNLADHFWRADGSILASAEDSETPPR